MVFYEEPVINKTSTDFDNVHALVLFLSFVWWQ